MDWKRIDYEFARLREAFPGARITSDRRFVYLPAVVLPSRYNVASTPVLIGLDSEVPNVFVSRDLRIRGKKPVAFLESSPDGARGGYAWFKLCWQNPPPVQNLRSLVASLIWYLEELPP